MTNSELSSLSLNDLRELLTRANDIYSLKLRMEGLVNSQKLKVGMTVRYVGGKGKIMNDTLVIEKISKVNAICKSNSTGVRWSVKLANIEECK